MKRICPFSFCKDGGMMYCNNGHPTASNTHVQALECMAWSGRYCKLIGRDNE